MSLSEVNTGFDIAQIRSQFPILDQEVNGHPLAYFDNAATTQKPQRVIDALNEYYTGFNSNIHRGAHTLADQATSAYEETRQAVQNFINAREAEEIIFTRGTTESINLVASTLGRQEVGAGDEVIISGMEHHSNIVPWQMLCEEKGASLKIIPVSEEGEISVDDFKGVLSEKTKIVSIVYASNSLGTINPVKEVIDAAHGVGAYVVVDGAQAMAHLKVDVKSLDCDFMAFSAHKMYGPTGCGVLYGKRRLLEQMPPYQGGGEMISRVSFEKTTFNEIPYKFEAGTPNIADVIAFREALNFIHTIGHDVMNNHETQLMKAVNDGFEGIPGLRIYGTAGNKVSVVSFLVENMHPFDTGMLLDAKGIAVRTGHHCTQPLMDQYGIEGTVRASFAIYNSMEEVDRLVESVKKIASR